MPNVTRDDIYLDQRCAVCDGTVIIIPAHGMFVQHEDADQEADHQATVLTPAGHHRSTRHPTHTMSETYEGWTLTDEGLVGGVQYVTVLDNGSNPYEYEVTAEHAEREYGLTLRNNTHPTT